MKTIQCPPTALLPLLHIASLKPTFYRNNYMATGFNYPAAKSHTRLELLNPPFTLFLSLFSDHFNSNFPTGFYRHWWSTDLIAFLQHCFPIQAISFLANYIRNSKSCLMWATLQERTCYHLSILLRTSLRFGTCNTVITASMCHHL